MDLNELSDIQSESAVIGTLLYHPKYIYNAENLQPKHFASVDNGCVYWAIRELLRDGISTIDAYNLSSKLQSENSIATTMANYNIPAMQEYFDLFQNAARNSVQEYKMYANNVISYAFKRELVKALNGMSQDCYKKDISLDDLNYIVYNKLDKLTQSFVVTDDVEPLGKKIDSLWAEIVSRRTENGIYGIPSKYPQFLEYFTYEPGELVVIQAKYKQGKSIFLMNEAIHKLKQGMPTLVVDSEMPDRLYTERLLSHLTGISIKKIKNGLYSDEDRKKIDDTISWLKNQPFIHIYDPDMRNEKLFNICKMLQRKANLQFVVYDYFKSNATSTGENYNILGAKVDFLKNNIAGELGLPVLAACQLNRNGEVADSNKINQYLSVGIKWGFKTQEMIATDGVECGNAYAKVYVNRLGPQMQEDDENDYIDFNFSGDIMTITEAKQHEKDELF